MNIKIIRIQLINQIKKGSFELPDPISRKDDVHKKEKTYKAIFLTNKKQIKSI